MAHKEGFAENHLGDKILTSLFRPREGAVRAPCDRSHPSENQIFLPLSSLISLHMDICALSLLGLCDKESSSYRIASKEWCSTASLTEEEKAKVVTKGLCANHSRHPERLRPEISTPPAKRSKSDPSTTSPSRKITDFPGWVPISPPRSGCEKLCNGINNPDLEEFIKDKHGFVYLDEEGYLWGEKLRGWTTYRARTCTGEVAGKKTRCDKCHRLFLAMACTRSRHNKSERESTQKFTPTSALKVSPYVRDLIEQWKKENKPTHQEKKESEDDIEVEVCSFISSTQVHN